MSARPVPARTGAAAARRPRRRRPRRGQVMRRRAALLATTVLAAAGIAAVVSPYLDRAVQEISLPLRHEDVIRQQARDKGLDPTLIAAVIYTESRFRDQTSPAGAEGLMQILPGTADYIARLSGGTEFERGDLAKPHINIAYGSYYLGYLLEKYGGNEVLSLAAYNAGEGKVDQWLADAARTGDRFRVAEHIPFRETRDYVGRVLDARARYRREYGRELRVRRGGRGG